MVDLPQLAAALGIGIGLGVVTGMPLGVINVAIVDAALAREARHALGLAVGGALADTVHTLLAFAGLGRVVSARPAWSRTLAVVAALAIVAFAVATWRRRRGLASRAASSPAGSTGSTGAPGVAHGVLSGIALTLPNPAALAAWVAMAAMIWPGASLAVAAALAVGVGVGSAGWFALLGRVIARVRPEHPALRIVPRAALVVFVGIAAIGVVRAF